MTPAHLIAAHPSRPSVEELRERYRRAGALGRPNVRNNSSTHPRAFADHEVRRIRELRPTHTLAAIGKMFGRYPSTIAEICSGINVDFRGRKSKPVRWNGENYNSIKAAALATLPAGKRYRAHHEHVRQNAKRLAVNESRSVA